jgi:hypothetical protein
MSKKKKPAKKPKTKKKAAKKAGSGGARASKAQRAADISRLSRRRSFSKVDRLPEALRKWVRDAYFDGSIEYADISRKVLIETAHPELRQKIADDLDWASRHALELHPDDGVERAAEYIRLRQGIYDKVCSHPKTMAASRKGEPWGDPVLLNHDVISRDYRRAAQSLREMEEHMAIAGDALQRAGSRSVASLALVLANNLMIRSIRIVAESDDAALEDKHKFLASVSRFAKVAVDFDRSRPADERAYQQALADLEAELLPLFDSRPDIRDELIAALRESKEEA